MLFCCTTWHLTILYFYGSLSLYLNTCIYVLGFMLFSNFYYPLLCVCYGFLLCVMVAMVTNTMCLCFGLFIESSTPSSHWDFALGILFSCIQCYSFISLSIGTLLFFVSLLRLILISETLSHFLQTLVPCTFEFCKGFDRLQMIIGNRSYCR